MDNERLKILVDALIKLSEYWVQGANGHANGGNLHSIYDQIHFIRRAITKELSKK